MKIIFYGYSGVHSAVIAGAAHLGILSSSRAAQINFSEVPFFGSQKVKYHLIFLGKDTQENEVYSLGVGKEIELLPRAIIDFLHLQKIGNEEIKLVNTITPLGWLTKVGELLAFTGCLKSGNYLVLQGMKFDYLKLIAHIRQKLL